MQYRPDVSLDKSNSAWTVLSVLGFNLDLSLTCAFEGFLVSAGSILFALWLTLDFTPALNRDRQWESVLSFELLTCSVLTVAFVLLSTLSPTFRPSLKLSWWNLPSSNDILSFITPSSLNDDLKPSTPSLNCSFEEKSSECLLSFALHSLLSATFWLDLTFDGSLLKDDEFKFVAQFASIPPEELSFFTLESVFTLLTAPLPK